jgi:aryl-alcohol dehydrogenase-like predicted oxidoreductase
MVERASDSAWGARRLGLGVSGPHGTPIVSRQGTEKLIHRAYELGVRLFDTAPSYGNGEAEKRLGEALARLPRLDFIISTKFGIYWSGPGRRERDFSADNVHRSIDASLERLKLQKLDWLFLHGPATHELSDELFKAVEAEQYAGRVGLLGVAGRGAEIDAALETGLFKVFMAPVHAGLDTDQMIRHSKIRNSGAELIGIETIAPSLPRYSLPTSAGDIWRIARHAAGRDSVSSQLSQTPERAIEWALTEGRAHRVVTTTTRASHLEENIRTANSIEPDA